MAFLSGLSMVAATVLSGRFLKWNTHRNNTPLGIWREPSQSPSNSFDTAGLAGVSSTLASPVRLDSIGAEVCGLVRVVHSRLEDAGSRVVRERSRLGAQSGLD